MQGNLLRAKQTMLISKSGLTVIFLIYSQTLLKNGANITSARATLMRYANGLHDKLPLFDILDSWVQN